jgi:hypothetical protein
LFEHNDVKHSLPIIIAAIIGGDGAVWDAVTVYVTQSSESLPKLRTVSVLL